MARAFFIEAEMPASFWVEAIQTAVLLLIGFLRSFFKANLRLKNYFISLLITIFLELLVAPVIPILLPPQ